MMASCVVFAAAVAEQKPVWKGTIAKEGDVIVVKNPREPMNRSPILTLREELKIGGSEAKGESALSRPYDIACDNEGNVYVLERSESVVKVFDKSGKYLRTIGRRGQGPGEFNFPVSLSVFPGKQEFYCGDRHVAFAPRDDNKGDARLSRRSPRRFAPRDDMKEKWARIRIY